MSVLIAVLSTALVLEALFGDVFASALATAFTTASSLALSKR
jgi:hypothetical protein